jgi:hypothetical protein
MAMDGLAFFGLVVASLAAFGALARRFGADSRDAFADTRPGRDTRPSGILAH